MPVAEHNKAIQITKEYEDFAYIVSHDLNAPLRHVKEFTRLIVGSRKEGLTEEEKRYVLFLEKSLQKLDAMQGALLSFSRLSTRVDSLRNTDFYQVITSVVNELSDGFKVYTPVIEFGNMPSMLADSDHIRLLFYHLIDNALKFHKENAPQRKVFISAKDHGRSWMFEVKDNGIGIDKRYHEEVFRMFRRLEPEKYPGIGAGLAIARKIVRRHGGEISIESEAGNGTNVLFSIAGPAIL